MAYAKNMVIAGDYKNGAVVSVLGEVSISDSSVKRLPLSIDTVQSYEIVTDERLKNAVSGGNPGLADDALLASAGIRDGAMLAENKRAHYLAIQFKDGKKSLLEVDRDLCTVIIKNCLAEAAIHCRVTLEEIVSCDPQNKASCGHCPCFQCVLWPKCCYGRIYGRREAYRNNNVAKIGPE